MRSVHSASVLLAGRHKDERYPNRLVVQDTLLVPLVRAMTVPVIAGKYHQRVFLQAVCPQGIEDLSQYCVGLFDQAVIDVTVQAPIFLGIVDNRLT